MDENKENQELEKGLQGDIQASSQYSQFSQLNQEDLQAERDADARKKKRIIGTVTAAIVIIILIILALTKCSTDAPINTGNDNKIQIGADANADNIEEKDQAAIQAQLDAIAKDSAINISMNSVVTFENGTSKGLANIKNQEVNTRPQFVEIVLADTEEEIYKSGLIEVGKEISEITLTKDLEPGEYDCVAYFNAYNIETETAIGRAGANITIVVQN